MAFLKPCLSGSHYRTILLSINAMLLIVSDRTGGRETSPSHPDLIACFFFGGGGIKQVQYTERLTIFGWSFGKADTT